MSGSRREFVQAAAALGLSQLPLARVLAQTAAAAPIAATPTLRATGQARGILTGCAVQTHRLRDTAGYADLVRAQAGIVVAESEFKFGPLRPTPTTFFFDDADFLADFAQKNGMALRGHNFVWHRQLSKWFDGHVTSTNAEQVLVQHIETVAGRYAGRVHSWDVVNEAIQVSDKLPGGLRDSPWQKVLPGYIDIAFRTARRADPKALLVYNDYGIEGEDAGSDAKRAAVLELLRGMQKRNVPLDGLGIQSHISAGPNHVYGPKLVKFMAEAQRMGLKLLLTEMDVNDRDLRADIGSRDAGVAETYRKFLDATLANPAVIALLTWGITDRYTWLNGEDSRADKVPERCLPFDADLQPTPAFAAEREALARAPARS